MILNKCLVTGRDIDLSKYNLGVIRQPKVEDFMGEFEMIDFMKCFYLERSWRVNGVLDENNVPFTFFLMFCNEQRKLLDSMIVSLKLIYKTDDVKFVDFGSSDVKIIIQVNGKPVAFIDDSNFDELCKVVIKMCHQDEPKKKENETYEGDPELVALVKQIEQEQAEKNKEKDALYFEEIVRRVIHMKKCFYDDIKNLTLWQLQDMFITYTYMTSEGISWNLASGGRHDVDKIKKWQEETKIMRENAK